jgi:pimeloyl-ACP methyl ester carboxylesterase
MHAELSRLSMFYEEYGDPQNPPVVLLHGGMSSALTWAEQIDALTPHFRVLAPEQQGHARTPDIDGPLTYQAMASDTIEFLERIAGRPAHLVGHSDGGILGLLIAMQRPDLLDRMVVIGANFHIDGLIPSPLTEQGHDHEMFVDSRDRYAEISPDGLSHWPIVFAKINRMMRTEPNLTTADIATIATATLVMAGDDDAIAHDHTIELYEALPEGQLAIVPGTSHSLKKEKPHIVNQLILDFLTDPVLPSSIKTVRANPS